METSAWKTFSADDWGAFTGAQWKIFRANPAPEPGETASVVCGRLTVLPMAAVRLELGSRAHGRLRSVPAATGRLAAVPAATGLLKGRPAVHATVEMLRC